MLEQEKAPFLVFGKPDITDFEIDAVTDVLKSGWIGNGKVAAKFEEKISDFLGGGYCVAVSSCTMALQLSLRVSNIGTGKEVITTPLTFAATVNAILREGATPVFVDVDPSGCIDPDRIRSAITDKTAGIIPMHYTGTPCDMGRIMSVAEHHNLSVIEDAAHGFGGEYVSRTFGDQSGRKLGTLGHYGAFSFHATKNITCGEGGMVYTKRADMAERIRILSRQGQSSGAWTRFNQSPIMPYEVTFDGYKGSLPDLLAALGLAQLARWDEISNKRAKIFRAYEKAFGVKEQGHSQHLYTIRVKNRDLMRKKLHEMGIGTSVQYTPLHLEPGYKYLRYKKGDFQNAERIGAETLSLPVSATMTEDDATRVIEAVKKLKEEVDA